MCSSRLRVFLEWEYLHLAMKKSVGVILSQAVAMFCVVSIFVGVTLFYLAARVCVSLRLSGELLPYMLDVFLQRTLGQYEVRL